MRPDLSLLLAGKFQRCVIDCTDPIIAIEVPGISVRQIHNHDIEGTGAYSADFGPVVVCGDYARHPVFQAIHVRNWNPTDARTDVPLISLSATPIIRQFVIACSTIAVARGPEHAGTGPSYRQPLLPHLHAGDRIASRTHRDASASCGRRLSRPCFFLGIRCHDSSRWGGQQHWLEGSQQEPCGQAHPAVMRHRPAWTVAACFPLKPPR